LSLSDLPPVGMAIPFLVLHVCAADIMLEPCR